MCFVHALLNDTDMPIDRMTSVLSSFRIITNHKPWQHLLPPDAWNAARKITIYSVSIYTGKLMLVSHKYLCVYPSVSHVKLFWKVQTWGPCCARQTQLSLGSDIRDGRWAHFYLYQRQKVWCSFVRVQHHIGLQLLPSPDHFCSFHCRCCWSV